LQTTTRTLNILATMADVAEVTKSLDDVVLAATEDEGELL
jgi:hypothetical protein